MPSRTGIPPAPADFPESATLSPKEFAHHLRCSEKTVVRRADDGTIKSFHFGKFLRIPRSELERLQNPPKPPPDDLDDHIKKNST